MLEDLEAALDPADASNDHRRWVAQQLLDSGIPDDDVLAIATAPDILREMSFRVLFPGARMNASEFGARVGLTPDQLLDVRRAAGLWVDDVGHHDRVFATVDEEAFVAFAGGVALFGEQATLQFVRVMGSALAQVAEAAVALFGARVAHPLSEQQATPEVQFKSEVLATQALAGVGSGLQTLFRFHAETAIRRLNRAREAAESYNTARLAVGFVDLVGFTPLAERIDAAALSDMFDEFEAIAYDVIAQHDARLVKLIGDAVMFTALEADAACDIALTLVEQFEGDHSPVTPRGALAFGEMLVRAGDYYGPVVNVAARAADQAVPYEILVTDELAAGTSDAFDVTPAGRRQLKGIASPVSLSTLTRATQGSGNGS